MLQPLRETFQAANFTNLLVGLDRADDAAVYQLNDAQAIINTTDFFPPIVDDPYDFGAIAAANAMSDVYAMGGQVLFCMNLVAFPDNLPRDILREIIRGGADKVAEAGGVVVGGHSVSDKEPKFGMAVTGLIDPEKVKRKGGSRPGDTLILTKPLGSGVVTTALKRGQASDEHVQIAAESMKTLNKQAAHAAQQAEANGMTDITGFGLLGHAHEMASQARVDFHFNLADLPWLEGSVSYGKAGAFPGGRGRNEDFFSEHVSFADAVPHLYRDMLWTPETSGGLLVSVPAGNEALYLEHCPAGVIVGQVTEGGGRIQVS